MTGGFLSQASQFYVNIKFCLFLSKIYRIFIYFSISYQLFCDFVTFYSFILSVRMVSYEL